MGRILILAALICVIFMDVRIVRLERISKSIDELSCDVEMIIVGREIDSIKHRQLFIQSAKEHLYGIE